MAINPVSQNNLDWFKKKKPVQVDTMQGTAPYVGVVDVPNLSSMPVQDALNKRESEFKPEKLPKKKNKMHPSIKFDILAGLMCIAGIALAIFKKIKK